MRAVVLGGAGYVGGRLGAALAAQGHDVLLRMAGGAGHVCTAAANAGRGD